MFPLNSILAAATFLAACTLALANSPEPTPTRPFTVRAYQSPYPIGQQLTGAYLSAEGGNFYLSQTAPASSPVLKVDQYGQAYLVS